MKKFKFIRGYSYEFNVGLLDYAISGLTVTNIDSEAGVVQYERYINGEHCYSYHLVQWCQNLVDFIPINRRVTFIGTMDDFLLCNFRRMEIPIIVAIKPINNFMVYSHLQKPDYSFGIHENLEIIYIR